MTAPQYVRVDKLGEHSPISGVPNHYWVKGELIGEVSQGYPLTVLRHENPNGSKPGIFKTTPIQSIDVIDPGENSVVFRTQNSTYKLTHLNDYVVPEAIRIAFEQG